MKNMMMKFFFFLFVLQLCGQKINAAKVIVIPYALENGKIQFLLGSEVMVPIRGVDTLITGFNTVKNANVFYPFEGLCEVDKKNDFFAAKVLVERTLGASCSTKETAVSEIVTSVFKTYQTKIGLQSKRVDTASEAIYFLNLASEIQEFQKNGISLGSTGATKTFKGGDFKLDHIIQRFNEIQESSRTGLTGGVFKTDDEAILSYFCAKLEWVSLEDIKKAIGKEPITTELTQGAIEFFDQFDFSKFLSDVKLKVADNSLLSLQTNLAALAASMKKLKDKLGEFSGKLGELGDKLWWMQFTTYPNQPYVDEALKKLRVAETRDHVLQNVKKKLKTVSDNSFVAYSYEANGKKYVISVASNPEPDCDLTKTIFLKSEQAACVNAANQGLTDGLGVAGAIFGASDKPQLNAACTKVKTANGITSVSVGKAVLTQSFFSNSTGPKWIVHVAGPKMNSDLTNRKTLLESSYVTSLMIADRAHLKFIAFPAISASIYGFNRKNLASESQDRDAWPIAINACLKYLDKNKDTSIEEIRFCIWPANADEQSWPKEYCDYLKAQKGVTEIKK